jgi:lysophospholipase L1-like esterase
MITKSRLYLWLWLILLVASLPGVSSADNNGVRYLVSVGTSLSVGIQPDLNGVNQQTDEGYPDQLLELVKGQFRKIKLVKLGCPGETTVTMTDGGLCAYPKGSQLAEVLSFLHAHKDKVELVTIDMGVNDILDSGCVSGTEIDEACLVAAIQDVAMNLTVIMTALKQAAHPDTPIIGMNYYNTFLASWLTGPEGEAFAMQSALLAAFFNTALGDVYGAFGVPVADVAGAFRSNDFEPLVPFPPPFNVVPINVALLCQWTYMCVPPPVGPNIHANPDGYGVIALEFFHEFLALPPI